MTKLEALNALVVSDSSVCGGECEYVLAEVSAGNIKVLLDAGFTPEQIDAAIDDDKTDIELSMLAFQFADAGWWSPADGFSTHAVETGAERKCRMCGCTQDNACPGGCYWVAPDLCSKCAPGSRYSQPCEISEGVESCADCGFCRKPENYVGIDFATGKNRTI